MSGCGPADWTSRTKSRPQPLKPAPDLFLLALERLGMGVDDVVCLGDGRYDRMACAAAGIRYVHLSHDPDETEEGPTITELGQLLGVLGLDGG